MGFLKKQSINIVLPCLISLVLSTLLIYGICTYYLYPLLNIRVNILDATNQFLVYLVSDIIFVILFIKECKNYFNAINNKKYAYLNKKLEKMRNELLFLCAIVVIIAIFHRFYLAFACIFLPIAFIVLSLAFTFYICCKRMIKYS